MNKLFYTFLLLFLGTNITLAEDLRFVQVDGLSFSAKDEKSEQRFDKIINDINSQKNVAFTVFSGNNIAKPSQEDLDAFLKEAKKLHKPYYVILGNKDVNKQKDMSKSNYMKTVSKKNSQHKKIDSPNYVFEKKGLVFIVLDGSKEIIPSSMGYYKPNTVTWLDQQLSLYSDKHVVILQHFPIIPPSNRESRFTSKPEMYLKVLAKHNNVKAIISGHFGVNNEQQINGINHISTAEAPTYRIIDIVDYEKDNPIFWSIIRD